MVLGTEPSDDLVLSYKIRDLYISQTMLCIYHPGSFSLWGATKSLIFRSPFAST